MNGKGDTRRPENNERFRKNFDRIMWPSKKNRVNWRKLMEEETDDAVGSIGDDRSGDCSE